MSSKTGIGSKSCARYWHECREWRETNTRVYASLQGAGTREQDETYHISVGTSDLGETRVEGSKAGKWGGLGYSR